MPDREVVVTVVTLSRQNDHPETQPMNPPKVKEDCPHRLIANANQKESPSKEKCQNADLITNARVPQNNLGEKEFSRNHKNLMNHTLKEHRKLNH